MGCQKIHSTYLSKDHYSHKHIMKCKQGCSAKTDCFTFLECITVSSESLH